jgi:adenylate cyclase
MDVFVKGKAKPVDLYEVLAIPSLGLELPRKEIRKSPRVEVNIPFTCQLVVNKIVMPQVHQGVIRDISYHGILAEMEQPLAPHSDVKMGLDMSLLGYKASDIYAKILTTREEAGRFLSGLEFTSVSVQSDINIKHFIQLLIQGSEIK